MATFTYAPSFSASQSSKPQTRVVKFNDGYEQRLSFGLNTDLKTWDLTFSNRSTQETIQITRFFESQRGTEAFSWTDPFGGIGYYVCEEWSVEMAAYNLNNIRAVFRQVVTT